MDFSPEEVLRLSTGVFMAGNLLGMGLGLRVGEALAGLRELRFVGWGLVCGFLLGPALAFLFAGLFRLDDAYATGLVLTGLAPCAPFLPAAVNRARGSLPAAASFLLLATIVTLAVVPFAVPWLVRGLTVDEGSIFRPLALYLLLPLVAGLGLRRMSERAARCLRPVVNGATALATLVMLGLCLYLFRGAILGTWGSRTLLALVLFTATLPSATWFLARGLPAPERSVLALGTGTRNLGVPFAVLSSSAHPDERSIAVLALAVPVTILGAFAASAWFARHLDRVSVRE